MKPKIKIVHSNYYPSITRRMIEEAKKQLKNNDYVFDSISVPGSFEIPYEIARSIKEDISINEQRTSTWKPKLTKEKIRDNIVQMAKLSQLNLDNKCMYSGYLALGCIIKGKTINHKAISISIFSNLQKLSIDNLIPIGNGIFNANNLEEAKKKNIKCTIQACKVLFALINDKKNK